MKIFFKSVAIRGLWTNAWNGNVTSFYESTMIKKIVRIVNRQEQVKFLEKLKQIGVNDSFILPLPEE